MNFKRKLMRYAHAEGHTSVCFTDDGSHMITCGSDGDFRIWAGLEDDDPSSHCVGEWALCIAFRENRLFVAADNNTVQAYTYPGFDKDGIIARFTAPVSHFATGPKSLVSGAQDYEISVVPFAEGEMVSLSGHTGPVLSVAVCPLEKLVASAAGDGTLRVWSLEEKSEIKQFECIPKTNNFTAAKVLGMPSFEPITGKYLAYPSDKEIVILDTATWQRKFSLTHMKIKSPFSLCVFSPCGAYIAASTTIGQMCVWDVATQQCSVISEHPNSYNVCSMAWNPSGNGELAFCDVFGQLGTIEHCFGSNKEAEPSSGNDCDVDLDNDMDYDHFPDDDSDNENAISLEKIKNETLKPEMIKEDDRASSAASVLGNAPVIPVAQLQPPFQPGATPVHLEHRYMVWNGTGIVRSHTSDTENSIEVEFHDSLTHHGIHMNNYLNHTMASLSNSVLALACETPSKLVCITLGASGSREWSAEMPQDEEILAIGCGDKLVAVATDNRLLRLFTIYGTQREVIAIPGPVVCLAGFGDKIVVVYHSATSFSEEQNMNIMFIQAVGLKIKCNDMRLPLSPNSKLSWLGFTDQGSPAFFDSVGILKVYVTLSGVWLPLCNTTTHVKGVSDRFFIIEVNESKQVLYAVLCRGSSYPQTNPRPAVAELPLQLPMCEMDTEKARFEEQLCRWSHCSVNQEEKLFKETALKLFALACRSELEQRAQELVEMISSPQLLTLAIKYASKLGLMHLADKLSTLAKDMEDRAESPMLFQPDNRNDVIVTPVAVAHNSSLLLDKKELDTTPIIAPLAVRALSQKRNPFKRSLTPNAGIPNPLRHLTDKVVGLSAKETDSDSQENESDTQSSALGHETEENETFMSWFTREKAALQAEHPNKSASELTKHAMRIFKTNSCKRKLSDDLENQPTNVKQSKLSAFAYKK